MLLELVDLGFGKPMDWIRREKTGCAEKLGGADISTAFRRIGAMRPNLYKLQAHLGKASAEPDHGPK